MKRSIRGCAVRFLVLIFLLVAGAGCALAALLYSTVPSLTGERPAPGLASAVTIHYDAHARPYVEASTLQDALYAEGWLHARHRLWQMELFRRAAKGRLAELLGSGMIETDAELWRMGVPQLAQALEANATDAMREYVDHYVNGVNAAMEANRFPPPEFLLLRHTPQPWEPIDVYAMGALMVFQSANNYTNELLRLALVDELGVDRTAVFLPDDREMDDFPYVLPRRAPDSASSITGALARLSALDPLEQIGLPSFAFGSNGWAVAPSRSVTGNALFAFDSHDSFGIPNLFYEVHLFFGEERQLRGWSVAGLPGIVNGFNEKIAWGFTNIGDSQDLFLETRSETDPLRFKDGEVWYKARTEEVQIPVSGRDTPETITIVYTKNGPLISEEPPIALRWTIQDLNGMGLDSILEFNLAQNWDEFTAAMDGFAGPPLNATYADVEGNIGFRTAGLLPVRGRGEGLFPLKGDNQASRWKGMIPMDELPEVLNPESGYVAAANARVSAWSDAPLISADNAPGYRIRRIQSVLSGRDDFTAEDMQKLQMDWYDSQAALLLPALLPLMDGAEFDAVERASLDAVRMWQGEPFAHPESGAALVFQAWYRALAINIFQPAMSEDLFAMLFKNNYPLNHALDRLILREPESEWWRDERASIVQAAFRDAVAEVRAELGDDPGLWRLDAMHAVLMEHELGKAVPQLGSFFNLKPAPWGGGPSTVGRARYRYDRAYNATGGATVRVVGEMIELPEMQAIIPGGQSGHPLSPHYDDQHGDWLAGNVLPISPTMLTYWESTEVLRPAS